MISWDDLEKPFSIKAVEVRFEGRVAIKGHSRTILVCVCRKRHPGSLPQSAVVYSYALTKGLIRFLVEIARVAIPEILVVKLTLQSEIKKLHKSFLRRGCFGIC